MEDLESERQKIKSRKVFLSRQGFSDRPSHEPSEFLLKNMIKKSSKIFEIFSRRTNAKELSLDEIMEILVVSPLPETAAVNFLDSKFFIWR